MYPPEIVNPMKSELTSKGFVQLNSDDDIKNLVKKGTTLIVINSICGCAAANARRGVIKSLENEKKPDQLLTSFAGVDKVATNNARELMFPFPHPHLVWLYLKMVKSFTCSKDTISRVEMQILFQKISKKRITNIANLFY